MLPSFQEVRRVFEAALDVPANERPAWLQEATAGNAELLAAVQGLLLHDVAASPVLDREGPPLASLRSPDERLLGTRIGCFQILRVLGSGGMGTVFEAEQDRPHRKVALKVMRHAFGGGTARVRFEYEAEILARLQHPGIAQVYEAATFEEGGVEQPFFAMELIAEARPIDTFAQQQHLSAPAILALVEQVCDAVHHGHQRGVIHRDLKPANILVDATGQPKLIDFGIARATHTDWHHTLATTSGSVVGTLAYMSPEQLDRSAATADTRIDVYALGVILFQLLTGRLPHELDNLPLGVATDRIRTQEPPRASTLAPTRGIPHDADCILQKAMAKDPDQRYSSAQALGDDLRRLRRGEPVLAGPPSTTYRLRKFVRRNRIVVAAATATLLALVVGTIATTLGWTRAVDAENLAEGRRLAAERIAAELWQVTELQSEILGSARGDRNIKLADVIERAQHRLAAATMTDQVAASLHSALGVSFDSLGLTEPAREQFLTALRRIGTQAAAMPRTALTVKMHYANLLAGIGKLDEAEPLLREALAGNLQQHGPAHRDTATVQSNLASVLLERGDYVGAEQLYRLACPVLTSTFGPQHHSTITAMTGHASSLHRQKRSDEAAVLYTEACALALQHLGAEDPATLSSQNTEAVFLLETGKLEPARRQFEALLTVRTKVSGPTHPATLRIASNIAICHERQGRHADAEVIYRQVLAARQAVGGGKEMSDLITRFNLAVALHLQRGEAKLLDSLDTLQALLRDAAQALPADNWRLAVFQQHEGIVLRKLRRFDEAATALAKARTVLEATLGPTNERTRANWSETAALYEARGQLEEAAKWRQKLAVPSPR